MNNILAFCLEYRSDFFFLFVYGNGMYMVMVHYLSVND